MLISTMNDLPGYRIDEVLGEVFGLTVRSRGMKGQHGHTIGAAGAIEAIVTLACFARNQLPPCANLVEPDVELDLVREARPATPDYAMSTGFGFGGHDAALIFKRA